MNKIKLNSVFPTAMDTNFTSVERSDALREAVTETGRKKMAELLRNFERKESPLMTSVLAILLQIRDRELKNLKFDLKIIKNRQTVPIESSEAEDQSSIP